MNKLKLLIVEGNTKEENVNFNNAGCVPQSQNFKLHIEKIEPKSEIDIVEPIDDNSISKIISSLVSSKKIHTVIHAAALSFPPESEKNQKIYFENNIKKTKTFIDVCVKNNIRKFIFLSSSNVYNFNPNNIKAASESQKNKPSNYYGKTKSIIEKYLKNKFEICYILRLLSLIHISEPTRPY